MIAFVRVVGVKPGKTGTAMAFAREMSGYLKSKYQRDVEVLRPMGGNPQRVAWSSRYASMAEAEAFNNQLMADAKYWEMVNGVAAECFVAGTMHDSFWQTV